MHTGTVSKILWHFTGGRLWDDTSSQFSDSIKSHSEASKILELIISSKLLRVGGFKEKIMINNNTLETRRVCCVADIPAIHLGEHSKRYGKCAIGFHREALIRKGFNPVFYIRQDKAALTELQSSFSQIEDFDFDAVNFLNLLQRNFNNHKDLKINDAISDEFESLKNKVTSLKQSMAYFQSFIKTINNSKDWNGIYLEREWRYPHNYHFDLDDIAMLVLPKKENIYELFCSSEFATNLPRKIPIIAFEDLVEH